MRPSLFHPTPLFALEGIDTQTDGFAQRLKGLYDLVKADIDAGKSPRQLANQPVIKEIEKAIFTRFGMKVEVVTHQAPAAILPFYSNKNHVFIPDFFRGEFTIRDQQKLLSKLDGQKGTVNLQKAKLSGFFSEYVHPLYLNFHQLLKDELTIEEIVAVTLHEIGHGFYACYYADRMDQTNQVLADIARHLLSKESGDVDYVYRELSKVTDKVKAEEVDKMLNGPKVVAGAAWFKAIVQVVSSQMDDSTYDQTAFEERADNFASRFGVGRELVLGLDKLYKGAPDKNRAIRFIVQLMAAMTTVAFAGLVIGLVVGGAAISALFCAVYGAIFLMTFREDLQDWTYDRVKDRYLRIRRDAIDQLKNNELSPAMQKHYLEMIYSIDAAIKETVVVKTLPANIANFIFSGARKASNAISDQQLMEALGSNNLFIQSARLQQLAMA